MMTRPERPNTVFELERRLGRLKGDLVACEAKAEELRALIHHVGETLNLRNKISRGGFTAAFFAQTLCAMGAQTIRLHEPD